MPYIYFLTEVVVRFYPKRIYILFYTKYSN